MKLLLSRIKYVLVGIAILCIPSAFADVNFIVSPILYEIETETGATIEKTAKLRNLSENTYTIYTSASDFTTNGTSGKPDFIRRSELVYPDQELSSWISISSGSFIIGPNEEKEISFTIDVPTDATPGGHYGAVFFKNNQSGTSPTGTAVNINIDYGVLVLVNVDGEIITEAEIPVDEIIVSAGSSDSGGWGSNGQARIPDDCLIDFTSSRYDGKCIELPGDTTDESNLELNSVDTPNEDGIPDGNTDDENFNVDFTIPFDNTGNTHIKPEGKITLIDEEGNEIKGVGKKIIKNDKGAVIGEEIVNYLPVNDAGGNVLPSSRRNFEVSWQGFPYKDYDMEGNQVIKYWTPNEYYTKKNVEDRGFLMFWERVMQEDRYKHITALIDIAYTDENGEEVVFSAAKEFPISYTESYIGLNPYVVVPMVFFALLGFFWWFLFLPKKRKEKEKAIKKALKKQLKKEEKKKKK